MSAAADAPPEPAAGRADPAAEARELDQLRDRIMAGEFAAAEAELAAFVERRPSVGRAWFYLALTHHKQRRHDEARVRFERALSLPPVDASLHHFYGYCLYYLGDMTGARREFETHLALAPREGAAHFAMGLVELEEGRLEQAGARFQDAIDLQRSMPGRGRDVAAAHARLADVLVQRGELEVAARHLDEAIRIYPDLYGAYLKLSRVQRRLGQTDEAAHSLATYEAVRARVRPEPGFPE
jgi:Tfp pilus assembly protein PilF